MFDIVGDIHGHSDILVQLLQKLNHLDNNENVIDNPHGRKLIFCGDLINRGPDTPKVLAIVKSLHDKGYAEVIPGNHEFFSLFYHLYGKEEFIQPYISKKAIAFFEHTMIQFRGKEKDWSMYMDWFMGFPMFIENNSLRVIHALWDDSYIQYLKENLKNISVGEVIKQIAENKNLDLLYKTNKLLRGREIKFEKEEQKQLGLYYQKMRTKWWLQDGEYNFAEYFLNIPEKSKQFLKGYGTKHELRHAGDLPLFFGHYSIETTPYLTSPQFCCLDFGVANGGPLIAYQFDGKTVLSKEKLIAIYRK